MYRGNNKLKKGANALSSITKKKKKIKKQKNDDGHFPEKLLFSRRTLKVNDAPSVTILQFRTKLYVLGTIFKY